jgi:aryl-alcohol dehydrogenase-like predicted oxidoreductase
MRKSLEQSLKALQTDYLDMFFIHEPHCQLSQIDDLIATSKKLKEEGKIKAFGLAYMRYQEPLHQSYLGFFDILQFDNSPGATGYEEVREIRGAHSNVLFSPLKSGTHALKPSEKLKKLFNDFPKSVVLCSMFNEQHLKENVALLQ